MEQKIEQIYITQAEAAKILGIKLPTIKKWRKKHKDFPKPYITSGTDVRFKKSEIIEWMEKRRVNA